MTLHGYETYIDGVPASSFNAECVSRNIAPATVISFTDWMRQSVNPLRYGSASQFKIIKLQFRFEYFSDEDLLAYSGGLTNALRNCQLKFGNMKYYFDCALSDSALAQIDGGKQELAVTLQSSYAYLPAVAVPVTGTSQTITAQGNLPSPAIVTITPSQDIGNLTLTGLTKKPITISSLHANAPVTIDGESCIATEPAHYRSADQPEPIHHCPRQSSVSRRCDAYPVAGHWQRVFDRIIQKADQSIQPARKRTCGDRR